MSKIGKINIPIPEKVKVLLSGNTINVEGPLGKQTLNVDLEMFELNINEEENAIELFSNNIIIAGQEFLDNPNQNPLITNWNRVETAMPDIKTRFLGIVESDSKI